MTTLTVGGYSLGNLDGISSVAAAAQQYNDNRTTSNLINYQAALANAAASATSLIPGEGAAFAGNAIAANIKNLSQNHSTMSASDFESSAIAIAGALATLVGQGVEISGLAAANINPLVGGGVFTLGEFINAVGFVISAAGVVIDSGTIAQIATQSLQALGLAPSPSGQYSPVTLSSSNFICDATNAATMWDIVKGDNTEQINSAPSNNGSGLNISNSIGGDIIVAPGSPGSPYTFSISGSDNNIMGINSTPITGSAVGVNVSGSGNTINAGTGTSVSLSNTNGNFDVVNSNGDQFNQGGGISLASNTQANVNGNGNGISVANGDSMGAYGGGNTINAASNSLVVASSTNGAFDTINTNGNTFGGTVANGQGTGVWLNQDAQANVNGNNNGISVTSGDSMGAYGGGNTINAASNSLVVASGTNGSYDTINANGNSFGGTTANGQGTGVWLDKNVQANVNGNNIGISVTSGDSMGAYGGGNTINATPNSVVYASGTNGSYDTINANGNSFGGAAANGQGTGVWLDKNVQANVNGNNIGISVTSGDSMGAYGGGNTINATPNSVVYASGTNGSYDTINANGNSFGGTAANGQGTGVWLDKNVQVNVNGAGNGIALNSGDSVGVYGGGNVVDAAPITTTAIYNTNGNAVVVNATGDLFGAVTANGQGSGIWLGQNAQATVNGNGNGIGLTAGATLTATGNSDIVNAAAGSVVNVSGTGDEINGSNSIINIAGNNETIWLSGESNVVTVTGQNVTVYAQNSTVNFVGSAANNNNNKLIGVKNTGSGWSSNDAWYALTGSSHPIGATAPFQLPVFTDPSASVPGDNVPNATDPVWIFIPYTYSPSGEPILSEPIIVTAPPDVGDSDPIILNLNGDKVQTTALEGSTTYFDMENEGEKNQTAWGTTGEGYLVYDPEDVDNAAVVTKDAQLVGGFGALQTMAQQFDGTGHGDLTVADALWANLKVWVDKTGSGNFQSGQLMSLDQLGITSIDLDGNQTDRNSNGNKIITDSSFTRADGSRGDIAGVDLMFSRNDTPSLVDAQVHNLISAMSLAGAAPGGQTSTGVADQNNLAALALPSH
ncbi:beta strand repeat-containing protein [Burkholderia glumae]|uniref:beta strand repeat-containing protein n=1 Tax=Burkholderia glumae TaxID=337 RepID=UPI0020CCAD34|nr:S-layer family protein [Burkholderia glumae]MCQ0034368.1 S-layer family protein [Burkholderia glumae]MCQ0039385.1 S-layer family protein [Burkholderia glumae]